MAERARPSQANSSRRSRGGRRRSRRRPGDSPAGVEAPSSSTRVSPGRSYAAAAVSAQPRRQHESTHAELMQTQVDAALNPTSHLRTPAVPSRRRSGLAEPKTGVHGGIVRNKRGTLTFDPNSSDVQDHSTTAVPVDDATAESIQHLVEDAIMKDMYGTAAFFADKLVSLRQGKPADIYLLGRCYFLSKQFKRAVLLLRAHNLVDYSLQFLYLASQCLAQCGDWEDCLALLGAENTAIASLDRIARRHQITPSSPSSRESAIDLAAAVCVLRGHVYERLENRRRAVVWYKQALQRDVKCVEAFERLVDKRMLPHKEEKQLVDNLSFPPGLEYLRMLYETKLDQFNQSSNSMPQKVTQLEEVHGFKNNCDILASLAQYHYQRNEFRQAYEVSRSIVVTDPYHYSVLPVHVCSLVELRRKSELYYCAHQLVEAYPDKAVAWFSVGCYYFLIGRYDAARKYFKKSTGLDHHFAPAWIGFGHSFAMQDESDQAMAAYRTAARLFEGSHSPLLCIGMEYLRTNNLTLAHQFFKQACDHCPTDPLVYNELGVILFKEERYGPAVEMFLKALNMVSDEAMECWEPTVFNAGHAFRKLQQFDQAIHFYNKALGLQPRNTSVSSALGFTYHLMGQLDKAIQHYHKALGTRSRDTFTQDMLNIALAEAMEDMPWDCITSTY